MPSQSESCYITTDTSHPHGPFFLQVFPGSGSAGFRPDSHDDSHESHGYFSIIITVSLLLPGWWYTYPSEKYESQWKDDIPYMKWKIKYMFETTNQIAIMFHKHKPIVFTHRFLQWVNFKDDLGVPSYLASNLHWDHDSIPLKNNLVNVYSLRTGKLPLLAIEIVDIPIKNGDLPNYL